MYADIIVRMYVCMHICVYVWVTCALFSSTNVGVWVRPFPAAHWGTVPLNEYDIPKLEGDTTTVTVTKPSYPELPWVPSIANTGGAGDDDEDAGAGVSCDGPPGAEELDPPELDPPELDPPELDPPELDPPELDPPELYPPELDPPYDGCGVCIIHYVLIYRDV